ncbi:protein disulfide-isomerase TMX3 [Zootoca vivipara]|uniref:protein disulfide-isomerase TMX3 n=1 Tax=Zootoca vivipara TaxID=8524 RepID=UPI0015909F59|nr:protein disulfide-isomerase TMX3 [Zootoca vivipara]
MAEGRRRERRSPLLWASVAALILVVDASFVEDLDDSFKENRKDDIWLVDFYAPWCGHCKKLEPVWNEVGKEMGSTGSPVKVGKMDATSYSSIASEFGVRGYPTIKLLKGDLAYNYRGPRTKDDIVEFANRVAGPIIRPLPSQQMFEHVQKRHRVFFLYIGGESPLKEKYIEVASELIVYTYFFSASEEILPEYVSLPEMPAVIVFKDGTYFVYDEYEDGDLSSWISKERFQGYLNVDGFTLYELGDTGKLVAIAIIDDKNTSVEHIRLKSIMQDVAKNHRDHFHRSFQFGHMDGNEYMNSLLMDDLKIPTIVVLNTSNQQYFLPHKPIESTEDMVQFINEILEGTAEAHGGDGILQRIKRIIYDAKSTVGSVFKSSPLLGCFLFGLPLGVISIMCYGICMADSDGRSDEVEASKKDSAGRELTDEGTEEEQEEENSENRLEFPGVLEVKNVDLNCAQNCSNHHTQFFNSNKLIVRRGQLFGFYVHFQNRDWDDDKDKITFTVTTGPKPCESLGTKSIFPLGGCPDQSRWNAYYKLHNEQCLHVSLFPPASACIGCYTLNMCLVSCEHSSTQHLGDFYVLFNPWCSDDPVYLDNHAHREEYVLNEHGIIFQGVPKHVTSHPWYFGQFQDGILDICLKILDTSTNFLRDPGMDYSCRNDPVYISRVLNSMICCHKKKSILKLPPSNNYLQGHNPLMWNGSAPILRQWFQSKCKPVKYGYCGTFASVLCTVMRCLGIPSRVVTGFYCPLNAVDPLAVQEVYDYTGKTLSGKEHIW